MTKAAAKAMATLRHIAAAGLPAGMVFNDVARCLAEIAPFQSATLVLYDQDLRPTDALVTHDICPEVSNRYFQRWFNRDEARFMPSHAGAARGGAPDVFKVSDYNPRLWETELYDEVFRELGFARMASMMLREGGRAVGNIAFGRAVGGPDYSEADLKAFQNAAAYAALALSRRAPEPGLFESADLEEVETGVVTTNREGDVLQLSHNASRLLRQASMAYYSPAAVLERWRVRGPDAEADAWAWARPLLAELSARVGAGLAGRPGAPAIVRRASPHGEFVLKAYAMEAQAAGRVDDTVVVQISRRTPLQARLFASALFRSLTPQEQVVCRRLLEGVGQPQIAAQLGLSPHTVVSHVRNLYRRTGANSRETLQAAVLNGGALALR